MTNESETKINEEPVTASDDNDDHDDEKATTEDQSMKDNEDSSTTENNKESKEDEEERKKRELELKKKYADWPLRGIKEPHENDVMYGRGGGTNHHPGNKRYRKMVEDRKLEYVNSKRLDKPLVALEIIRVWRAQIPPGRFLKLDEKTGLWQDVGDKKAREKTSQALREKAPLIRKQQEEEDGQTHDDEDVRMLSIARAWFQHDSSSMFADPTTFVPFFCRQKRVKQRQLGLPKEPKLRMQMKLKRLF